MNYHNCPSCGRLVMGQSEGELLCKRCAIEEGDPYKRVRDYVYDHRGATVLETEAATGVSRSLIMKYVKEGRISLMEDRSILNICKDCGVAIDYGEYCRTCKGNIGEVELKKSGTSKNLSSTFGRRRRR